MLTICKLNTCPYNQESKCMREWIDCNDENWDFCQNYRIKKDIKPFENAHECFEEMQKHPPIGWLRQKQPRNYVHISYISTCLNLLSISYCNTIKSCNYYLQFRQGPQRKIEVYK